MGCQRIAVCDDEKAALIAINHYIENTLRQYGIDFDISSFQSVKAMIKNMEENVYDVCFLDIDMPEMNGIDLAKQIYQKHTHTLIVFISAKEEYVFQSFCVHPFSFVRKAHFKEEMERVIKDIVRILYEQQQNVRIIDEAGYEYTFLLDSIDYLEAKGKYVDIVLTDSKKMIRCSMKYLEKELEPYGLIRCHKSYIVNLKKIYAVKHDHLVMLDKTELPIRRGMVTELKKRLCSVMVQ